jgi:hydroxyacylglutathione hydrolase
MIQIKKFIFNPIQVNTYVLYNENKCFIIDPGCYFDSEYTELYEFIESQKLIPVGIIITHFHFDHLMGCARIVKKYNISLSGHPGYKLLYEHMDVQKQAQFFDFEMEQPPLPERELHDDEIITLGNSKMKVIHIPGHSPCGIAIYSEEGKFVISGDILFEGSVGRTDLYLGDMDLLIKGIKQKLLTLDKETMVFPGHGNDTTIEQEIKNNPFF